MPKKSQILPLLVGLWAGLGGRPAQADLLNINRDTSSPYYAGFQNQDLAVNYTYDGNGAGTFHIGAATVDNYYYAGSLSAGTHGQDNAVFSGSFSLYATIAQDVSGNWGVTGGSMDIYGNLPGVSTSSSDLLFSGDLTTGPNAFGYADGSPEFDFLFTTTGGNPAIVQDFFGVGTGQGGIILTQIPTYPDYTTYSSLFSSFSDYGYSETVVPEPAVFPLTASLAALYGWVRARRKHPSASLPH
jgi:hypothetical protein